MGNWDMPPIENKTESSRDRYCGRAKIVERLSTELGTGHSIVEDFSGIILADGRIVRVALGVGNFRRNGARYPDELLRVFVSDENGVEKKIDWEDLDEGDKSDILRTAYPSGNIEKILGE